MCKAQAEVDEAAMGKGNVEGAAVEGHASEEALRRTTYPSRGNSHPLSGTTR